LIFCILRNIKINILRDNKFKIVIHNVLRKIYECKREEARTKWRTLQNPQLRYGD